MKMIRTEGGELIASNSITRIKGHIFWTTDGNEYQALVEDEHFSDLDFFDYELVPAAPGTYFIRWNEDGPIIGPALVAWKLSRTERWPAVSDGYDFCLHPDGRVECFFTSEDD